uniref:TF-B3 domain-containing protein n=1 Tax=Oryza barthii TaxID=65489 RepID=A0A0D3GYY6_9ORYZ
MGTSCERCRRRDEQDYRNLDDSQKHFLLTMMGDFQHEMIIPKEFVQRLKGDIPGEIQLETRNRNSHTVRVDKTQEKVIFTEGWAQFVKTFDLQMGDSMMFRFNGNSQFDVIIVDQIGREKACSAVVDDSQNPNVQERRVDATETLNSSRAHSQPMPMQSTTETVNHSHARPCPMHTAVDCMPLSHAHPQPMPMQFPTETVNHCHAPTGPMEMPLENVALSHAHARPLQMQSQPTDRLTQVQRGNSSKGNMTTMSSSSMSSGYSLSSKDQDCRVGVIPDPIIGQKTILSRVQVNVVKRKIQNIGSQIPIFVSVIGKNNASGRISSLSIANRYVDNYLQDEKTICLSRLGDKWNIRLSDSSGNRRMVGGCRKFAEDNDVGVGDICLFELLKNHKCTMKVHIIRAKDIC